MTPFHAAVALSLAVLVGCKATGRNGSSTKDALTSSQNQAAYARFAKWIEPLSPLLDSGLSAHEASEAMLGEIKKIRAIVFSMQALGRLYQKQNETFDPLRDSFKELEDGMGEYDKWTELHKKGVAAGASEEIIAKLQSGQTAAKNSFEELLATRGWAGTEQPKLREWNEFLSNYPWLPYDDERLVLIQALDKQINKISKREWDLSRLEEGNGLHELKRELRWFQIELQVVNGLVTFREDPNDCPVEEFKSLLSDPIAQNPFSQLPRASTEKNPCFISQCLYLAGAKYVADLDALKGDVEFEVNTTEVVTNDAVPADKLSKAQAVLKSIVETSYAAKVSEQLQACLL
jgi:hypothetical protein